MQVIENPVLYKPVIYKNNTEGNRFIIPRDWQDKAWEFAAKSNSFKYYQEERNASDSRRQRGQIFMGKIAEYAASKWFEHQYGVRLDPDLEIYDAPKKSWEADLPYTETGLPIDLHVKSCAELIENKVNPFRTSWIFQYRNANNNYGLDGLFKNGTQKDFICCACVRQDEPTDDNLVHIMAFIPWKGIDGVRRMLQIPQLNKHYGKKKALYWDYVLDTYEDSEYAI